MSPTRSATEREVKLGAWAGFRLPELGGVLDGVTSAPMAKRDLKAVYYDTSDLRLARWGVTVRHRTGEGTAWTVKLPEGEEGPALVRREVSCDGPPDRVPDEALGLVCAYLRREPLVVVANIDTKRSGVTLSDVEGLAVAEVVDDEVSVLHDGRVAARFREVEVEVADRAPPGLIDAVVRRLRKAGAGRPDATPKLVRALGERALRPAELSEVDLGERPTAAEVIRATMVASVIRILRHDAGVRIGDDPEDIHQARVGTRRLRSDLRTFSPLLAEIWVGSLRGELKWVAAELGAVRDADVLTERLRRQAEELPGRDGAGLAPLFRRLAKEREEAGARLLVSMSSDRYLELLDRLVAAARAPDLRAEADEPADQVVAELVGRPWRHLKKTVGQLPPEPSDGELHEVRIRAKRTRYAAEAATPAVGSGAKAFAKKLARLQEILGDHHDAVVAEEWLRLAADGATAAEALAAGELIAVQRAEEAACRAAWPAAWKRVAKKKRRSGLG
ncbi:MAG: CYTH and CHAD domain-containing protein [Actinomycetota bacterium]|nr:CYTH and CHAD domain-containing protein [Actinomycetota bacterium]